ncbi:hypothetical protein LTR62_004390 [Meristemomyces frigidus]|uniref:Glycoside hydrolase family 43 protein n=1 Tax=Meristemomyces frigidus TaxID=1508187 RepID=A0AAN7TDZ9_9PEZI|nr:hypothetical protein LTR62_004390 [Meristemomyces frigidus]
MSYLFAGLSLLILSAHASPIPALDVAKRWTSTVGGGGNANFPDPAVTEVDGKWYAFATRTIGSSIHIQVAESSDFSTWTIATNPDGSQHDALPNLPSWVNAASPNTWAPDIVQLEDNTFIMYYSATTASNPSAHCIGAAKASTILGPYEPTSPDALICPIDQGGAIDASGFTDAGQRYIVYKIDGNSIGHGGACGGNVAPYVPTPLMLQAVAADGLTLQGASTILLDNAGASDQGIVEAPALTKVGPTYILFFSSNCFAAGQYTLSYATSQSISGPYIRATQPLLSTGTQGLKSPGGADVHTDGVHIVFHGGYDGGRTMYQGTISVESGVVSIDSGDWTAYILGGLESGAQSAQA